MLYSKLYFPPSPCLGILVRKHTQGGKNGQNEEAEMRGKITRVTARTISLSFCYSSIDFAAYFLSLRDIHNLQCWETISNSSLPAPSLSRVISVIASLSNFNLQGGFRVLNSLHCFESQFEYDCRIWLFFQIARRECVE
jgi:hypothetical protein